MADEMTRQEFAEYMTAFEQRLDGRFAQIDAHFAQIDARFAQINTRFAQVDARFAQINTRFAQVDARFDDLTQRMTIQFEDVRGDIRFSLEAVTGLREMTERRFDEMRADHEGQIGLLKTAVHHLSRRVGATGPRPRS